MEMYQSPQVVLSQAQAFVEANDFEYDCMYHYWVEQHRQIRQQDWVHSRHGFALDVGKWRGMPVCVSCRFARIQGALVCFYYGCSMVVHHEMVKKFLLQKQPTAATSDARNFHNVLAHIERTAAQRA